LYCSARGLIETMRIDEATKILGIRINVFTAIILGILALRYLVHTSERFVGRELLVDGRYAPAGYIAPVPSVQEEQEEQDQLVVIGEVEAAAEVEPDSFTELIAELEPDVFPEPISAPVSQVDSSVESDFTGAVDEIAIQEAATDALKPRGRRARPKGFKY